MQRVLVFDGDKAAKRFELCRTALLSGGDGKGERTREVIRKEARLLDALDSVSVVDPANADNRILSGDSVTISQNDHELLSKYLDTTQWLPRVAREVVDVQDWFGAAEKVETP